MFPGIVVQDSNGRKILGTNLLVEDDSNFAEFLQKGAFGWEPVRVELVAEGEAALAFVQRHKVDLIVLADLVQTSGKNGSEICRYLRNSSNYRSIPIVMLASNEDVYAQLIEEKCADAYFLKPFDLEEFLRTLGRLLSHLSPGTDIVVAWDEPL